MVEDMIRISQVVSGVVALALAMAVSSAYGAQDTAVSLPSVESILKRAAEQSQKEDDIEEAFKRHYTYTRTKITEYKDSDGKVKKREEKTRTSKARGETQRTPQVASRTVNPRGAAQISEKDRAFEKSDFALTDDILNRFDFVVKGRETIAGRSTIVMDFKPKAKDLPEHNIKDKFINRAAGRVWLDEEDFALAKADLFLTEKVSVIGGLVGAVWKFNYKLLRERTSDGLWFARTVNWHLEGREVFAQRIIDYSEQRTDVKKAWEFQTASK
jgi:hypothetical protein